MKLTLIQTDGDDEEIIIRYGKMTDELQDIIRYIEKQDHTLIATADGQQAIVRTRDIIYCESIDAMTFLYTKNNVYKCGISLAGIEAAYTQDGFFRCSKSMIINAYRISRLKSEPGNRIDAMMDNGEHVIISRRYARELRKLLKGGKAGHEKI